MKGLIWKSSKQQIRYVLSYIFLVNISGVGFNPFTIFIVFTLIGQFTKTHGYLLTLLIISYSILFISETVRSSRQQSLTESVCGSFISIQGSGRFTNLTGKGIIYVSMVSRMNC